MADPATLTAQELIDAATTTVPETATVDMGALRDKVFGELNRRLADPEAVKDIPGTGLIQLAKELAKQTQDDTPKDDGESVSILDRIDALPREHAIALIKGEIARIDSLRDDYFQALERIQEEP